MRIKHTTNTDISLDRISDLLCCALEGGSNYWYNIDRFVEPTPDPLNPESGFKHLDYPLSKDGALIISSEDYKGKRLDLESIRKGLVTMSKKYPHHMNNFVEDNEDAETGDVFLQCALFGEVIYG